MIHVTTDDSQTTRHGPERTCVGCRAHDARADLVRFAHDGTRLVLDARGRLGGRGVWVHARRGCVVRAVRGGGFARVLRSKVPFEVTDVLTRMLLEDECRMATLLGSARRARRVAIGADDCRDAIARGDARLVVIAKDASASENLVGEVARNAAVPVLEIGTKESLGCVFGKQESSSVVVTDAGFASSISRVATRIAALSEGE